MKGRESGMPDAPYWESFFNPACIVERLDCRGPHDAVEFGCGYGTFTLPAARLVGGRVFALDIEPGLVAEVACKAAEAELTNITAAVRLRGWVRTKPAVRALAEAHARSIVTLDFNSIPERFALSASAGNMGPRFCVCP